MVRDRADSARRPTPRPRTVHPVLPRMAQRDRSLSGMGSWLPYGSAEAMHPDAREPRPVVGSPVASRAFALSTHQDGQSFVDETVVGWRTSVRSCRSETGCPSLWDADRPELAGSPGLGISTRRKGDGPIGRFLRVSAMSSRKDSTPDPSMSSMLTPSTPVARTSLPAPARMSLADDLVVERVWNLNDLNHHRWPCVKAPRCAGRGRGT
jgi:hypothetical protein